MLGSTGKVGGYVLDMCLEAGHSVKVLVRSEAKLDSHKQQVTGESTEPKFPENITCVQGSATDKSKLLEVLQGADVVISALGSPSKQQLVMAKSATALIAAMQEMEASPRVIWCSATGVNEATRQAKKTGCKPWCLPSCSIFCGYGLFGLMQFKCLIPCVIGQGVWDDIRDAELEFRKHEDIVARTTIVRPTNMWPVDPGKTLSEEWRAALGSLEYAIVMADQPPPNHWITRGAVAKAMLDLSQSNTYQGKAVSTFQG